MKIEIATLIILILWIMDFSMKTDDKMTEMTEINTKLDKIIALIESNMTIKEKEKDIDHKDYEMVLNESNKNKEIKEILNYVLDDPKINQKTRQMINQAAACGRLDVMQFIKRDYNASYVEHIKNAATQGNIDIVKYFIKHSSGNTDLHVYSALDHAIVYGQLNIIKYLIEEVNGDRNNALECASKYLNLDVIKYLVEEAGANVHYNNNVVLQNAKRSGNTEIIEYIQSKMAETSDTETKIQEYIKGYGNISKREIIIHAATSGRLDVIKYLFDNYKIDISWSEEELALQNAIKNGHLDIVKYFITCNDGNERKNVVLYWAAYDQLEILKYIIEDLKFDIHSHNNVAFQNAKRGGNLKIIEYVQSKMEEATANAIACDTRNEIQKFMDDCEKNDGAREMATKAAKYGRLDVVKYFINKLTGKIGINIGDLLKIAVEYGHLNIVKYLVDEMDFNLQHTDKYLLNIAFDKGHTEIFKYLINHDTIIKKE